MSVKKDRKFLLCVSIAASYIALYLGFSVVNIKNGISSQAEDIPFCILE